jgi:hypothetical protein
MIPGLLLMHWEHVKQWDLNTCTYILVLICKLLYTTFQVNLQHIYLPYWTIIISKRILDYNWWNVVFVLKHVFTLMFYRLMNNKIVGYERIHLFAYHHSLYAKPCHLYLTQYPFHVHADFERLVLLPLYTNRSTDASSFGIGRGLSPMHIKALACNPSDQNIGLCTADYNVSDCEHTHSKAVGIDCSGSITVIRPFYLKSCNFKFISFSQIKFWVSSSNHYNPHHCCHHFHSYNHYL